MDFDASEPVEERESAEEGGAAAWIVTFADLMSLLMAFFVLLHSFAEMDLARFQEIANSMRGAFGDQRDMISVDPSAEHSATQKDRATIATSPNAPTHYLHRASGTLDIPRPAVGGLTDRLLADAKAMQQALAQEIRDQKVEVIAGNGRIMLRVQEVETFPSGSAELLDEFSPLIAKIRNLLQETDGQIYVAGHTDNVPIATSRYRSNWELSSARAVSVVHKLVETGEIPPNRIHVQGYGDTQPLHANDSHEHRALNRRVEIVVTYDETGEMEPTAGEPAPAEDGPEPGSAVAGAGEG